MWKRISLRARIYVILTSLVFITLVGGSVTVWYTYRMQALLTHMIDRNIAAFQTAAALEAALVNQKGFVSYYFLDGDPDWLRQLGEYRQIFKEKLNEARSLVDTEEQNEVIKRIESEYTWYINSKDQVIAHYKAGERKIGARLHREVRDRFFKILDLCESYKGFQTERIREARAQSRAQANRLRVTAVTGMLIVLLLALLLTFVLVSQILGPVRRLALEADPEGGSKGGEDEVKALNKSVRGLIQEYDHTQIELVRSREHLLQAEKMALVGKLAAGMAHSIRNPLTSVNMRLFSLSRALDLLAPQKEDFEVISDEIRHIDTIVENFLEFSRPPKLKMQRVSPSDVVDLAIKLLEHRLQSYEVEIKLQRRLPLPEIQADPEQLKEVLVNLVVNGCEAMERGGLIVIHEEKSFAEPLGKVVVIRLTDNGPGIPESIQEKVLQPFFTTKEEGTGLGLSIAARIVEQHGGWLDLTSKEGEGTTFVITLPIKD
jgi:signal transduction histidine kinase